MEIITKIGSKNFKIDLSRKIQDYELRQIQKRNQKPKAMTTTFPPNPPKDFNDWAQHIYKLINNIKK